MAVSQLFPGPTAASALTATQRFRHAAPNQMTAAAPIDRHGLPQTMTAARIEQLGPPQIIAVARVQVPEPQDLQVLVRVCAAGVGPWDAMVRTGKSGLPITPP